MPITHAHPVVTARVDDNLKTTNIFICIFSFFHCVDFDWVQFICIDEEGHARSSQRAQNTLFKHTLD